MSLTEAGLEEEMLVPNMLISNNKQKNAKYKLKGKPISIVTTNIPSYQGGRFNVWKDARHRIGIQNPYNQTGVHFKY